MFSTLVNFFRYTEGDTLMFTQVSFWVFFGVLLAGYTFVYNRSVARSAYLLVFSLFFYFKSSGLFFSLLLFSTLVDYTIGLLISQSKCKRNRQLLVALSVVTNLSVLSYFKYAYFFVDIINGVFGTQWVVFNHLAQWGNALFNTSFDTASIILPVGISFYTFQTISYTVDVYRGKVSPVRNILDFAFYVSFFPQLVAGPIVRAAEFIPQIKRKFEVSYNEFGHALFLILAGLVKKMVISDYLSVNFVDRVFDNPLSYTGFENLMATYGYAMQIYCDFSGYTDIALGLALLLGFKLPINFNSPYKATSLTDFWHRWHISLSSWLRDYLYIPLGGNRKGRFRTYLNLMVTMLLGGLWHGAHLKYVVWGGIHGIGLIIEKLLSGYGLINLYRVKPINRMLWGIITFNIVSLSWVFFRAADFSSAMVMLRQIVTDFSFKTIPHVLAAYADVFLMLIFGYMIHLLPYNVKEIIRGRFIAMPVSIKVAFTVVVILILIQFQTMELKPFIYFRF